MYTTMGCKNTETREAVKERAAMLAFFLHHPVYAVCGDDSIPNPVLIAEPCELGVRVEICREYEEWAEEFEFDPQFICAPRGFILGSIIPSDPQIEAPQLQVGCAA